MATDSSDPRTKIISLQDTLFMVLIGVYLGLLGGLMQKSVVSVIWAALLVGIWRVYNRLMVSNKAMAIGLVMGGGLGTAVGVVGWLLGGTIHDVSSGALFGLIRGVLVGIAVGFITRAKSEENDTQQTKILIIGGSILLGLVLGGLVGLAVGIILGLIGTEMQGAIWAAVAGAILGATIASYFKNTLWMALAAFILAVLAAISNLLGGAVAGIVVGGISGSFAPILLVSAIGAFGGLTGRGLKAMLIEALEAPMEMMEQGAVPFLAPAVIIGMIIGSVSAGVEGILALTIAFAFLGLFFGIFDELSGGSNRITIRSMIEAAMLGAESWPLSRVLQQVKSQSKVAVIAAGIGASIALVGGIAGVALSRLLLTLS